MSYLLTTGILSQVRNNPLPGDFTNSTYTSGAYVAYSLRKVIAAYNGPVVRVRRSSDNTTQDFTADEVVNGTLLTFVGAGDGFVNILYNQTATASMNLTQSTNANQPIIVESGVLYTENNRPSMKFSGSQWINHSTAASWNWLHSQKISVFMVHRIRDANPNNLFVLWGTTISTGAGNHGIYFAYDDRSSVPRNNTSVHVAGSSGTTINAASQNIFTVQKLVTSRVHSTPNAVASLRSYVGVDSSSLQQTNLETRNPTVATPNWALKLGEANSQFRLIGSISELIIYYQGSEGGTINMLERDAQIDSAIKRHYNIT